MAVIPVFVASSFLDFQQERDALRSRVAPALSEEVAEFGARVEFVDLRWGAADPGLTEEERDAQVIEVCRREIDRSRPLILGMLGKRYGGILPRERFPERELIGLPREVDEAIGRISVTEFELLYAIHAVEDPQVVVLSRQLKGAPPEAWHEGLEQADALRRRLQATSSVTYRNYWAKLQKDGMVDVSAFEREAVRILSRRVRDIAQRLAVEGRYPNAERHLMEESREAVGRDRQVADVLADLRSGRSVFIAEPAAHGKTVLFSRVMASLREEAGARSVAGVAIGHGGVDTLLALMVELDRQVSPEPSGSPDAVRAWIDDAVIQSGGDDRVGIRQQRVAGFGAGLVAEAAKRGVRYLLIDGVDRLRGSYVDRALVWNLLQPAHEASPVSLLYLSNTLPLAVEVPERRIGLLTGEEAATMLDGLVANSGRRRLPGNALAIVARQERSPLWVRSAYECIAGLGAGDLEAAVGPDGDWAQGLADLVLEVLEGLPEDEAGVLLTAIEGAANRLRRRDPLSLGRELVDLVAAVPDGVSLTLVAEVLETDQRRVAASIASLSFILEVSNVERSVRIAHPSVGTLLHQRLGDSVVKESHRRIANALQRRPRTARESVAWVRSAVRGGDVEMARTALEQSAGQILRSPADVDDLCSLFIEDLERARILMSRDGLEGPALEVMCLAVRRRLEGGLSFAPDEEELRYLARLAESVEADLSDGSALPFQLAVDLLNQIELRLNRSRSRTTEDAATEGAAFARRQFGAVLAALCRQPDLSVKDALFCVGSATKAITAGRGFIDRPAEVLAGCEVLHGEIERRCDRAAARGTPPSENLLRGTCLMWLSGLNLFSLSLKSASTSREEADELVSRIEMLEIRIQDLAARFGGDLTADDEEGLLRRFGEWAKRLAVRPDRVDAARPRVLPDVSDTSGL
jgi:hypothetical protein